MEKAQKEYYLNEKVKAIQLELGRKDDRVNEIEEMRRKIEANPSKPEVIKTVRGIGYRFAPDG